MSNRVAKKTDVTKPSLDKLNHIVGDDISRVNEVIIANISQDVKLIGDIGRHIIASGGKRLRPAMTISCAKLCGYDNASGKRHINLAAAVELLHTATLLHDDVVDESTLRRGDKTANDIWSNQASVLVGDFLLSRAFQLMVADGNLDVLKLLSDASATISQGEVKQLMFAGNPEISFDDYLDVINAKTAALFAAATTVGAIISDSSPEITKNLYEFGQNLGIAFQLVDDALDYAASQAKLGKSVGDDFRERKTTMPLILAYAAANAEEKIFWQRTIGKNEQTPEDLTHAISLMEKHNTIEKTIEKARDYCQQAEENLNIFPASPAKSALIETLNFCVNREF